MAIAGFALEDEELIRRGITNINGFDYFIRYYLDDDGGTAEGSSGYLTYMMTGYVKTMEPARRGGLDLWQYPKAQKYFSLVARLAFPNFHLPAFGDGDYGQKGRGFYHLETARQRFHSPALNWLTSAMRRDMAREGTSFYTQDMVLRQVGLEPPPEATAYQPKSENLTDFGYAVLRTGEGSRHIAIGFTYGLPGGHGHNDRLGIILYGLDRVLAPDGCLPDFKGYQDPVYFSYFQRAVSHNTATVDETCCRRRASRSEFFGLSPRVKCVSATNEEAYPGVRQQRTLVLTDAYAIDLFSLRSDTPRRYDWVYHNFGKLSTDIAQNPVAGVLGATTGYDCITEVRKGWADASWAATWDLGEKGKLVLKMAARPGTQVCSGKVLRYDGEVSQDVPMVIARRWGAATDYVTTIEPAAGDSTVRAIHALTGDGQAVGARVEEEGGTCIVVVGSRQSTSTLRSTDGQTQISLKGKFGAACFGDQTLRYAYLVEGQTLEAGALRLAVQPEATVYVEMASPRALSVQNQSRQPVALTLKVGDSSQRIEPLPAGATRQLPMAPLAAEASPKVRPVDAHPVRPLPTGDGRGQVERPGDNLVRNSGFEESTDGLPSDWQPFDYSPNRPDNPIMWSRDDQVAHTGKSSVQIPPLRSYMDITKTNGCMQQVSAHGGEKTFIVSAWVKAAPPPSLEFERYYRQQDMLHLVRPTTRVRVFLCGYRPGWGWEYAGAASPVFQVGTEWQMVTRQVTFPPGITRVNLILTRPYQIGKAPVWFDDVSVTMVGRGAE